MQEEKLHNNNNTATMKNPLHYLPPFVYSEYWSTLEHFLVSILAWHACLVQFNNLSYLRKPWIFQFIWEISSFCEFCGLLRNPELYIELGFAETFQEAHIKSKTFTQTSLVMQSLSWVINEWWHQFGSIVYGRLFWFLLNQRSAAQ